MPDNLIKELSDYSGRTAFANHYGTENCMMLGPWETADIMFHDETIGANRLVECKMLSNDNIERYPDTLMVEKSKVDRLLRRSEHFGLASPLMFFCIVFERGQFIAWRLDCSKLEGMRTVTVYAKSEMESDRSEAKEAYIVRKDECEKIINIKKI